ncbi:uncharacterized protein LOC62_06G008460 [Vanrija pseudolonga]|uniref:Uncharacterized protein n=1 Tax=Vanrija pseudolonga TaxID=143232 RepID=A0AAF0YJW4_9TREE|nr:hypothetical protein LOC62_06G008460 [Vanrija pseudolonga]
MRPAVFPSLTLSTPALSLSALPLALAAGVLALSSRTTTHRRCLLPIAGRIALPFAAVLFAMSLSPRAAPALALLAAAVGLAVPLVLFLQSRRHSRMNGHAAPASASPLKTTPAASRRIALLAGRLRDAFLGRAGRRTPLQQPAAYPESCFDDDFLRILGAAHERAARRATPTPPAKTLPPAPWPKDWPVYWEGGGPAGLGRWA